MIQLDGDNLMGGTRSRGVQKDNQFPSLAENPHTMPSYSNGTIYRNNLTRLKFHGSG